MKILVVWGHFKASDLSKTSALTFPGIKKKTGFSTSNLWSLRICDDESERNAKFGGVLCSCLRSFVGGFSFVTGRQSSQHFRGGFSWSLLSTDTELWLYELKILKIFLSYPPTFLATGSPRMGDLDRNIYIYIYPLFILFSILSPFQNNSCCYS